MLFLLYMQKSNHRSKNCSVIILAAGHSSRMGAPKFALPFKNGKIFLEVIISRYEEFGCYNIIVVLNEDGHKLIRDKNIEIAENIIVAINPYPDKGRFFSIQTGINNVKNDSPVFIHNVDNPFVNLAMLKKMLLSLNSDFVVPVFNGRGGHPVLLSPGICNKLKNEKNAEINFRDFLASFKKTKLQVADNNILVNINTREEYDKYMKKYF